MNGSGESNKPLKRYIFCNRCKSETNHICEAEHVRNFIDEESRFEEQLGFRLWICAGCERGTLEEFYTNDAMYGYNGESGFDVSYYPERTTLHVEGKRFKQLPKKLEAICREVLHAYNYQLGVLCSIGIRALLEGICADRGITARNLEDRINGLASIIPQNIVSNLHSIRFIGNVAAHELSAPDRSELRLAIEICEDLLNYLYELDYKARLLANQWC